MRITDFYTWQWSEFLRNMKVYAAFIDLEMALNKVNRKGLRVVFLNFFLNS